MSLSLAELVRLLPSPPLATPAIPTGITALDAALPGGGLPRGRLTELAGPAGSGKTTIARAIVEATVAERGWVAYVDAQRTLDPRDWAHLGDAEGVWMIRPHDATRAAWCADVLLRSGAFALVVLDGAPALTRSNAVRLTRLARDAGCALLVLGDRAGAATQLGGAVRLVVERSTPGQRRRPAARLDARREGREGRRQGGSSTSSSDGGTTRTILVRVEKGGTLRTVEVSCAVAVARRLCAHPEVPDRRGVARGPAGGSRHARSGRAASPPADVTGRHTTVSADPPRELRTAVARARALG
jgi:energy-coupling factor transporter ATP-binding protein EcfA2